MREKKSVWTNIGRILAAGLLVAATLVAGACNLAKSPTEPEPPAAAGLNVVSLQGGLSSTIFISTAENTCGLLDGYGAPVSTSNVKIVTTQSGSRIKVQCKAKGLDGPGKAVKWDIDNTDGMKCSVGGDQTTSDWHETVSASGKATLTCYLR